jgi:polar amino acid transport system substrate-binding protein
MKSKRRIAQAFAATALGTTLSLLAPAAVRAEIPCGAEYVLQEGDSLAKIATEAYGKPSNWTLIFYANQDRLGANATLLSPGVSLRIPCLPGAQPALPDLATAPAVTKKPTTTEFTSTVKRIEFLTADDFAPFTTRTLENGGLVTEVLTAAMTRLKAQSSDAFSFQVSWVNDWSAHLQPLLTTRAFDMGFPWFKPNCDDFLSLDDNSKLRCQKFFFSDSIIDEATLMFVRADSPITFSTDDEMVGKTLCRPSGYYVFDLDASGRGWLRDKKITLLTPQSIDECMTLLVDGKIDAVSISELPGRTSLIRLGVLNKVRVLERPTVIGGLHVLVAKTHPNARTLIYYVNTALRELKESGEYDKIVDRQLQSYFDMLAEQTRPQAPTASAEPAPAAPADEPATSVDAPSATADAKPAAN